MGSFGINFLFFWASADAKASSFVNASADRLARQGGGQDGGTSRMGQIGLMGRMYLWTVMGTGCAGVEIGFVFERSHFGKQGLSGWFNGV